MLRTLLVFTLIGLAACSAPQRLDLHAAGGAITFADGQEISRQQAAEVVADVQMHSSAPAYRASILALACEHAEKWKTEHPHAWERIEISWHIDVIGSEDGDDGYAKFRATSGPASWVDPGGSFLPVLDDGVLAVRLEAETLLTPYQQPTNALALIPQAALLAHGDRPFSASFSRPLLNAIRETQLELIRQACAKRGLKLR